MIQRGGFVIGNVVVGNLFLSDFPKLPGALDFVLQWTGTPQAPLNDLNLGVFSPLHTAAAPDFVANPPFIYSLNPNSAASRKIAAEYPSKSRSGGRITDNSIGPDGLEIAYWPKGFPTGGYRAFVYDLVDAKTPPATRMDPVSYSVDVYLNGTLTYANTGTIGLLQESGGILETIPPAASSAAAVSASAAHTHESPTAHGPAQQAASCRVHSPDERSSPDCRGAIVPAVSGNDYSDISAAWWSMLRTLHDLERSLDRDVVQQV